MLAEFMVYLKDREQPIRLFADRWELHDNILRCYRDGNKIARFIYVQGIVEVNKNN